MKVDAEAKPEMLSKWIEASRQQAIVHWFTGWPTPSIQQSTIDKGPAELSSLFDGCGSASEEHDWLQNVYGIHDDGDGDGAGRFAFKVIMTLEARNERRASPSLMSCPPSIYLCSPASKQRIAKLLVRSVSENIGFSDIPTRSWLFIAQISALKVSQSSIIDLDCDCLVLWLDWMAFFSCLDETILVRKWRIKGRLHSVGGVFRHSSHVLDLIE